jgi:hypothetical protein
MIEWERKGATGKIVGTRIEVDFPWYREKPMYAVYLMKNDDSLSTISATEVKLGDIEAEVTLSDDEIVERALALAVTHTLSE